MPSASKATVGDFIHFLKPYRFKILFSIFLVIFVFFRFYELSARADLGWDQADTAWAAKSILVDNFFRLEGVPVKGNTGIFMGPLYYYYAAIPYFFTDLNIIASPIIAGITSVIGFLVLYIITKKLFNRSIAFISVFIYTFSLSLMMIDRIQNGIGLVVPVSYVIFYFLYKVITGNERFLIPLGLMLGLSFHVDFTAVFYPMLIFCALPFFPWKRSALPHLLGFTSIFVLFLVPILLVELQTGNSTSGSFANLFNNYYHGFYITRVLQLTHDAFIQFMAIFDFNYIFDYFAFLIPPIFAIFYYRNHPTKNSLKLFYLILLWIVVPWFVLSTYRGELTDSYFSLPRNIFIAILAYFTLRLLKAKNIALKAIVIIFWGYFAVYNAYHFFYVNDRNFIATHNAVKAAIQNGVVILVDGKSAASYIYYYYTDFGKKE